MLSEVTLDDINVTRQQLETTQEQMSSGLRITKPSDDPYGASQLLQIADSTARATESGKTLTDSAGWLSQTDSAIQSLIDLTNRAKELGQQALGTVNATDRSNMAQEVDQLIESVKGDANQTWGDRYIFSGTNTNQKPYSETDDLYHGDSGSVTREIAQGVQLNINITGQNLIGDGTTGLLATLRNLSTDLKTNNVANIQNNDLPGLTTGLSNLLSQAATVGSLQDRVTTAQSTLSSLQLQLESARSSTGDADYAQLAVTFNSRSASLQAALQAAANINQTTLMDYLK